MKPHHEHEFEAAPGLPEPLPRGERLLWQGRPDWRQLALHAFHVRKLAFYFAFMLLVQLLYLLGEPDGQWLLPVLSSTALAALALLLLAATAWWSARNTLYTVTDRRILMRIGIVLTVTFNLPLRQLVAAAVRPMGQHGHGEIALTLAAGNRIGWFHLWPHARPWALREPQPCLRGLPDVAALGALIQSAWLGANPQALAELGPLVPPVQGSPQAVQAARSAGPRSSIQGAVA